METWHKTHQEQGESQRAESLAHTLKSLCEKDETAAGARILHTRELLGQAYRESLARARNLFEAGA